MREGDPAGLIERAYRYEVRARAALARWGKQYRPDLLAELTLAVPPTITVLVVFYALQGLTSHRVLFASLASSAFLIYRDPLHRMNSVRVMMSAQLLACAIGVSAALLLGNGYLASALALVGSIVLLIGLRIVHPPAVGTALGFAFLAPQDRTLSIFLLSLAGIAMLALLQRAMIWMLAELERRIQFVRRW